MRSSPCIRGAPHVGFSTSIRKINSRTSFGVRFLPTCLRTLEISRQYIRSPVPEDYGFGRDQDERLLPSRPDPPSYYPEELIEEVKARARMSTLQRDELLTQSEILEKETSPPAKEPAERSETETDKGQHG
jgi:hypothetical protein